MILTLHADPPHATFIALETLASELARHGSVDRTSIDMTVTLADGTRVEFRPLLRRTSDGPDRTQAVNAELRITGADADVSALGSLIDTLRGAPLALDIKTAALGASLDRDRVIEAVRAAAAHEDETRLSQRNEAAFNVLVVLVTTLILAGLIAFVPYTGLKIGGRGVALLAILPVLWIAKRAIDR